MSTCMYIFTEYIYRINTYVFSVNIYIFYVYHARMCVSVWLWCVHIAQVMNILCMYYICIYMYILDVSLIFCKYIHILHVYMYVYIYRIYLQNKYIHIFYMYIHVYSGSIVSDRQIDRQEDRQTDRRERRGPSSFSLQCLSLVYLSSMSAHHLSLSMSAHHLVMTAHRRSLSDALPSSSDVRP